MSINTVKEITTLLSKQTTQEEKTLATNNVINDYNLDLTVDEILNVFDRARYNIANHYKSYTTYEYLLNFLLTKNIEMFIAVIKAKNYDTEIVKKHLLTILVKTHVPFKVGIDNFCELYFTVEYYKILLNYNDFNIDNLELPEIARKQIQEYRNKKYGGKLTKVAN